MDAALRLENRKMVAKLVTICVLMVAFGYLMIPLYKQICKATGIDRTRAVGTANTQVDVTREVKVEFLASSAGLPWKFEALDHDVMLHPGEYATVHYRVVNTLGRPVTAHAQWSTAPEQAARWIEKQQCFCFTNQTLAAGESRDMPVVFRVRPDAPKDLGNIVLSYTFLEAPGGAS